MKKWEYKLLKKKLDEQELIIFELNKLGKEGWEMYREIQEQFISLKDFISD